MTPSELKQAANVTHFFDRKTMRFFGDTMRNYGVRSATINTLYGKIECWELYRKRPVMHGNKESTYFSKDTMKIVYEVAE